MNDNRCFVISPIGLEGTDVRKHSDSVFRFIIEPAMKRCDLTPVRADHLAQPGKISDQMFDEILNDQLCIAVLTDQNPNVFYEVAVAQAAARPVILLIQKGQDLPFDVKDLRYVDYDLWPGPLVDGVYADRVVEQILELEGLGWTMKMPFGDGLKPLGRDSNEDLSFFATSEAYGPSSTWLKLLEETEEVFEIMGINLRLWRSTSDFGKTLVAKAESGCEVRALLIHEDNPCLRSLINDRAEEDTQDSYEHIRDEVGRVAEFFSGLADKSENLGMRQIRNGCPHLQLARTDRYGVYVPYLYSQRTQFSPAWQCERDHSVYQMLALEFEGLWQANEAPSPEGSYQ